MNCFPSAGDMWYVCALMMAVKLYWLSLVCNSALIQLQHILVFPLPFPSCVTDMYRSVASNWFNSQCVQDDFEGFHNIIHQQLPFTTTSTAEVPFSDKGEWHSARAPQFIRAHSDCYYPTFCLMMRRIHCCSGSLHYGDWAGKPTSRTMMKSSRGSSKEGNTSVKRHHQKYALSLATASA